MYLVVIGKLILVDAETAKYIHFTASFQETRSITLPNKYSIPRLLLASRVWD